MKKLSLLLTGAIILGCTSSGAAQSTRIVTKAGRAVIGRSAVEMGGLSHYNGSVGGLMGVDFYLNRQMAHLQTQPDLPSAATVPATPKIPLQRSWLEQKTRDAKAWNLRRQRRQRDKQQAQLEQSKAALPKLLPEQTFQAIDFLDYTPEIKQYPRPVLPFVQEEGMAYRGLALATNGEAIRNILQNGLRIEDSGEESNTLRMAYASHGGYAALRPLIENPVINITCSPRSATYWGSKRLNLDKRLLVVIQLRGDWEGAGLEVVTTDIPASQIETLAVRLNINGLLTWCKTQLNADGTFTLTPYERIFN